MSSDRRQREGLDGLRPRLNLHYSDHTSKDGKVHIAIPLREYNKFSPTILGLGDVSQNGKTFDGLAAIFDLEGFTRFCSRPDSHLDTGDYLSKFLRWLFAEISTEFQKDKSTNSVLLWAVLPSYAKFLGDGVLFLWDVSDSRYSGDLGVGNIVVRLRHVCTKYTKDFLPKVRKQFTRPPTRLRCGVARGHLISVGDGNDYIGPCINAASRLQKLGKLSFACSRMGLDPEKCFDEKVQRSFVPKLASIRGIGEDELILVHKQDFARLSARDRKLFADPEELSLPHAECEANRAFPPIGGSDSSPKTSDCSI